MTPFFIILFGLWAYPILSFLFFRFTKSKPHVRRLVLIVSVLVTLLSILGLLTQVSTTVSTLDWLIISLIYLTISLALVWTQFQRLKVVRVIGIILMPLIFGLGYLSGSIGALGVGLIIGHYETQYENWLGDELIYKERITGTGESDDRGKKVELHKTIAWFPIVEWQIQQKDFKEYVPIMTTPLTVDFKSEANKVYLTGSLWLESEGKIISWSDSLLF